MCLSLIRKVYSLIFSRPRRHHHSLILRNFVLVMSKGGPLGALRLRPDSHGDHSTISLAVCSVGTKQSMPTSATKSSAATDTAPDPSVHGPYGFLWPCFILLVWVLFLQSLTQFSQSLGHFSDRHFHSLSHSFVRSSLLLL